MGNKNSRGNASSHNHNLVTNNKNTIENTKWKLNLLRQAKLDLLNNMNFENSLVNRNNLANQIAENRDQNWKNHKTHHVYTYTSIQTLYTYVYTNFIYSVYKVFIRMYTNFVDVCIKVCIRICYEKPKRKPQGISRR